jgi:hypothetical protein
VKPDRPVRRRLLFGLSWSRRRSRWSPAAPARTKPASLDLRRHRRASRWPPPTRDGARHRPSPCICKAGEEEFLESHKPAPGSASGAIPSTFAFPIAPARGSTRRRRSLNDGFGPVDRSRRARSDGETQYKPISTTRWRHAFDDPWTDRSTPMAEGTIEYSICCCSCRRTRPLDLFNPDRRHHGVKLYLKPRLHHRFDCEGPGAGLAALPAAASSTRPDLPLSISREMLQQNPLVAKIRQAT